MNRTLPFIFLMFIVISLNAKNFYKFSFESEPVEHQKIAFGQPFSYHLDDNTSWKIINSKNFSVINSGIGSIENITFSTPGNFEIEIIESESALLKECNHDHSARKIALEVSPIKMIFDFNTIKFNNEIVGGQSQYGNEVSIDVYFETFDKKDLEFTNGKVMSAGIEVDIAGQLKNERIVLKQGVNHLVYKLNGTASSNTYIMLDFYDINNQIVTYTYPTIIK